MKKLILSLAVGVLCATPLTSHATAQVVVAPMGAEAAGAFASPVTVASKSAPLEFVNLDALAHAPHNVKSIVNGPDSAPWCGGGAYTAGHCPLFVSGLVPLGGTSQADLRNTVVGQTYAFICALHGNMKGTLVVGP